MIEIGYNFLKKDLDKIKRFKNPTLHINKNKLNKNSKYKIFLNKTQFNNLLDQGFIKYKLTDSKKMNIQNSKGRWYWKLIENGFQYDKTCFT